jgi:hypothetical protein
MKRFKLFLSIFLWSFLSLTVNAQNAPKTKIQNLIACTGENIQFPVKVTDFNNIGAISLTLKYNPSVLEFLGFTPNSGLPSNFTIEAVIPGTAIISGYVMEGGPGINLSDSAVLCWLSFSYSGGFSNLTWYDNGTSCEYASYSTSPPGFSTLNDLPQPSYYFNGSISEHARPTVSVSGDATINKGEYTDITFNLTGTPPWSLTYTDGTTPITVTSIQTSPLLVSVNPQITTTYSATALSDAVCAALPGDISGSALITVNEYPMDIILQKNPTCGEFTVKLKPQFATAFDLTKIIFTVKWAATTGSDVQLTNITPNWPGLTQQGSRVLYGGNYYVTFESTTNFTINWAANSENAIMNFKISGTGEGTTDFIIIASDYNTVVPGLNTAYYIEVASADATGNIINNANGASLNCGLYLKDFLQGAYNTVTHQMRTDLNNGPYGMFLPLSQPYTYAPFSYAGTESVSSFTASVVDWVLIELRTDSLASSRFARQAALLLSNGNIVSTDQVNPPVFHNIIPGNSYYVVIYHRNHLPVMTSGAIPLPNLNSTRHNFTTSPATNVYFSTIGVYPVEAGVYAQIAGDINQNNKLKYSGSGNDRVLIVAKINAIYTPPPPLSLISTIYGYYAEDVNMNGQVKYSGSGNDGLIISTIINHFISPSTLLSVFSGKVPY